MSKNAFFSLVVGKEDDLMLNIVCQLASENSIFEQELRAHGVWERYLKFRTGMMSGTKTVEWCNGKGCTGGDCEHKK